jgi:enoyl-CoA hydratase/carnithine racemase
MDDRVVVTMADGIAHVELARPDKLNALDLPMFEALSRAAETLRSDASLRCVVLSGRGRAFSAGLDIGSFMTMGGEAGRLFESHPGSPANRAQHAAYGWSALPVPVIAAVHGVCFGGGLQIALAADIRVASPDAQLSVMEVKWGLVPDMTGSQTLRHLVGLDVAKELTFTARVLRGREAHALGLVTYLHDDPVVRAHELAREIAVRSPDAVRAAKQLLDASVRLDHAAGLELEAALQRKLIGSPNQMEAVLANTMKRAPRFSDPDGRPS